MTHALPISLRFMLDGRMLHAGVVRARPDRFSVRVGDGVFEIDSVERSPASVRFACDGLAERAACHRDGPLLLLHYRGRQLRVEDHTRAAALKAGDAAGDGKLRASMNGRVVAVMVAVGDTVEAGQPIMTLEAMKMEHVHAAPSSGRVTALHVKTGDQVAASRVVAELAIEAP